MNQRKGTSLMASPVLVGAVTVLVAIVAVFLSYNANLGLPFVPTYTLKAKVRNAAELGKGGDVRIGGSRVGTVTSVTPIANPGGDATAEIKMKLDKDLEPLPVDTTFFIRPRSPLGLKYVEVTPGSAKVGYGQNTTVPLRQAKPQPVDLDQVLDSFDEPARRGSQESLNGFAGALAGRGQSLNEAISALDPLVSDLEPVASNLASPQTQLARLFPALQQTASEVAPVAQAQADLFGGLDTTFTALAAIARPYFQETISESPPTLAVSTTELPRQRPFLRNLAAFMHDLRPGAAVLPSTAPPLADAAEIGARVLPRTPPLQRRLANAFDALQEFGEEPQVPLGLKRFAGFTKSIRPTLDFLAPVQTTCNYVTLWFRNIGDSLSEGDSNGTWLRSGGIGSALGPNNEGAPADRPANGQYTADDRNYLHANPYPNTASPGQTRECEAGNEPYLKGRQVIGNLPGSQGLTTAGQKGRR